MPDLPRRGLLRLRRDSSRWGDQCRAGSGHRPGRSGFRTQSTLMIFHSSLTLASCR